MNKVTLITNKKTGLFVNPFDKNPEEARILLEQEIDVISNGYSTTQVRQTSLRGKTKRLLQIYSEGQELSGNIVRHTSFVPFWEGQKPCQMPDKDGIPGKVMQKDGKVYYHNYFYTSDLTETDKWVNVEESSVPSSISAKVEEQAL